MILISASFNYDYNNIIDIAPASESEIVITFCQNGIVNGSGGRVYRVLEGTVLSGPAERIARHHAPRVCQLCAERALGRRTLQRHADLAGRRHLYRDDSAVFGERERQPHQPGHQHRFRHCRPHHSSAGLMLRHQPVRRCHLGGRLLQSLNATVADRPLLCRQPSQSVADPSTGSRNGGRLHVLSHIHRVRHSRQKPQ